jgi:hypothetical protein
VEATIAGLLEAWDVVVADVDADVEGQRATGSIDVEERHAASRATVHRADVAIVVSRPGLAGVAALARSVHDLLDHGVAPEAVVPVLNRVPRRMTQVEIVRAWPALVEHTDVRPPLVVPDVPATEARVRDRRLVPPRITRSLGRAVDALLERRPDRDASGDDDTYEVIQPGSLGALAFSADDLEGDAA